jgi:hypothetical protein
MSARELLFRAVGCAPTQKGRNWMPGCGESLLFMPGGGESFLFMPGGVSERLQAQVRERGVTPVPVDVSEFLKKGGGSVKCIIGDVGVVGGVTAP